MALQAQAERAEGLDIALKEAQAQAAAQRQKAGRPGFAWRLDTNIHGA